MTTTRVNFIQSYNLLCCFHYFLLFFSFYSVDLNIQKYKNSFDPNLVTEVCVLERVFFVAGQIE